MMTKYFAALLLIIMVMAPCAHAKEDMTAGIDGLLTDSVLNGAVTGIMMMDLSTGKVLYSRNAENVMTPASNMKVVTGAMALVALGPKFRFYTDYFVKNFDPQTGLGNGLMVKGYGDPSLKEEFTETATAGMDAHAQMLKAAGLEKVEGVLWLDGSFFSDNKRPDSWESEDMVWCYAPRPGALAVGGNCLQAVVKGGAKSGRTPTIEFDPYLDPDLVTINVKTVSKGNSGVKITQNSKGKITISGKIRAGKSIKVEYPVPYPDLLFGAALMGAMKKAGITVKLDMRTRADIPMGYELFKRVGSPELHTILSEMGHESDNFVAEQMVRTIGALRGRAGSHHEGRTVITSLMVNNKFADAKNFLMDDGSGLSRNNRLSPRVLIGILGAFYNSYLRADMFEMLAVPGEEGTLKKRVHHANGRLWAKTGALRGVCSLSGYYVRPNGNVAAFSMIMNGYKVHSSEIRALQDKIIDYMLNI